NRLDSYQLKPFSENTISLTNCRPSLQSDYLSGFYLSLQQIKKPDQGHVLFAIKSSKVILLCCSIQQLDIRRFLGSFRHVVVNELKNLLIFQRRIVRKVRDRISLQLLL